MEKPYVDLDIFRLSSSYECVNFENQLLLLDNLDSEVEQNDTHSVNHPAKVSFTIAIMCVRGHMNFQVSLQDFELHTNDVLVIQEGNIGEYRGASPDVKVVVMAVAQGFCNVTSQIDTTMSLLHRLYISPLIHTTPEAMQETLTIYRLMKAKINETNNPFRRGILLGYLQVLTHNSYNLLTESSNTSSNSNLPRHQEIFNNFIAEVRKNYTKERSVSFYADALCVSAKYLSQVIRKASGRLAGEWISDYVILEAKALLKSRKYSIQQVSDLLNFANQSFFGRYFKDKVGLSPSEYQNTD